MKWPSIPPTIPRWLHRHPLALTTVVTVVNRIRRRNATWRSASDVIAITILVGAVLTLVGTGAWVGFAVQLAVNYSGVVVAASGLYAASVMSRRRRTFETARARSWLVATPLASYWSRRPILLTTLTLGWRFAAAVGVAVLLSLNPSVSVEQSLTLSALIAIGIAAGGLCGWWLSRGPTEQGKPASRYAPKPKNETSTAPSSEALSRWPITQAFAWGRPENARLLFGAAILTMPGGTGILGALVILGTWTVGSYLVALVIAIPHVGRSASQWLRSTPITFWSFAWPLARRAFLHQVIGTLVVLGVMLALGMSPSTAMYVGALWLAVVVLIWAVSLADCYRARSSATKTAISTFVTLLAEERVHGLGISIAVFIAVLHLHFGRNHERA
jgi:hypothetical protein